MIIPVILSGGAGTRLWPVSRETHPKPFMRLSDGQSLLQKTLGRVAAMDGIPEVLTVTNREFYFKTKDEYATLPSNKVKNTYLLEPFGRNTTAAIGMAALYISAKYGPDSVLFILPADHLIEESDSFPEAVRQAYAVAKEDKLITFGIKPTLPETGFGYIKLGALYNKKTYHVAQFVEKPSVSLAEEYCASGEYLWNSGMFCFKAQTLLDQLQELSPDIYASVVECWNETQKEESIPDTLEIDAETFRGIADLSIDYAIMEKASEVVVVPCDFTWSDIGNWNAVSDLVQADAAGNRVVGEGLLIDVTNTYVQSTERLVAAVGVHNLLIIDTPDALLVADRDRSQDVKQIVSQLKKNNHDCYKIHRTVVRPWGTYTILEEGEHFKMKRIIVKPGASLSLQMHHHRSEHWVVVSGVAKVTNGDKVYVLSTNESTFIPARNQHRLENPGLVDLVLIEVQTGEYLGEDDIVRFEDKYGRDGLTTKIKKEKKEEDVASTVS